MEMSVNTIVVALFLVLVQAYPKDLKFYDLKSNAISYEDAQKLSSLIITFEADREYKIQLQNNTLNLSNVKSNICSYSAKLFDQPSYGIFNLCDLTAKIFTNDRYIEIKDDVTITKQENVVDDDKMEDNEEDSKYMKIFIINDNNRVKHYGSEINNNTIDIYKVAKNIIEREDWGKYKIKLVLNGILNIVDGNYDDVKEKRQSPEQIDSDDALYSTNDEDREFFTDKHNKGHGKRREIKTKSDSDMQTHEKDKEKLIENVIKEPENVSEDVTKDKGPHTIDIKELINDFRERTIEQAENNLKNNWKAPCIKLMYDNKKAFNTSEVNLLDPETERKIRDLAINDTTSEISSYKLPKSTNLGFIKIEHVQQSTKDDAERSSKTLKRFADIFENIRNHQKDADSLLAGSNLVIMLTTKKDRANIEGMTFIGGACSSNDAFSIIKLRPSDSNFYHGKVTAHEILHSLDARHDVECGEGYLMEEQGCTTCMEDDRRISKCTIKQVTSFIDRQNPKCFRMNNLCGNGVIDEGEECDSGLPFGSDCCTANCKLRKDCECDDRNGTCCFECKLLPKDGTCKNITSTMNDNSCIKEYLCDGKTANCHQIYKKDGESCSGGFCKNGICQKREVFCDRIDRKFDSSREKANECKLVCVDENLRSSIMGTVGKDEVIPLSLPDGMPCMIDNISGSCYNGECKLKPSPKNYLLPLAFIAAILFSSSLILLFLL